MSYTLADIAFIDFEASSLSPRSWPIEIGVAWVAAGEIKTWGSLINPHESWPLDDWNEESAAIHNIKLEWLMGAPSVEAVAEAFEREVGDRLLVASAPNFDQMWSNRLFRTAKVAPLPLINGFESPSEALGRWDPAREAAFMDQIMLGGEPAHRAVADAKAYAEAFRFALSDEVPGLRGKEADASPAPRV